MAVNEGAALEFSSLETTAKTGNRVARST
jgi:hypothetical protein